MAEVFHVALVIGNRLSYNNNKLTRPIPSSPDLNDIFCNPKINTLPNRRILHKSTISFIKEMILSDLKCSMFNVNFCDNSCINVKIEDNFDQFELVYSSVETLFYYSLPIQIPKPIQMIDLFYDASVSMVKRGHFYVSGDLDVNIKTLAISNVKLTRLYFKLDNKQELIYKLH